MSTTQFTADLRDIRFVLHEELEAVETLHNAGLNLDFDQDLCNSLVETAYELANGTLSDLNRIGDRTGLGFANNAVTTPPGFKEAFKNLAEGGWIGITADPKYGGMGMPHIMDTATGELCTGAAPAFVMYPGLTKAAANLLAVFGADEYRDLVCQKLFSGEWGGTMCLTEPGAGSDVGANTTRATPSDQPGVYHLVGEKIWISGGDSDLVANIIHLVLARLPDAPPGTKGLSIFLVPKFEFDGEGNLGERNGIYVEGLEHKMGINASATCAIALGARHTCKGWLIGQIGEGMNIMFHMMNEARIAVGVQGLSAAAAAYQYALAFTSTRVQGVDIKDFGNAGAPKVTVNRHPDVRRMLMWQRVHVEAMRSLLYDTTLKLDLIRASEGTDAEKELRGHVELMTPIIKSYLSDKGFESAVLGLQCFGGSGYTQEYPVEQVVRDTKIASIYEGTNGIQAMDLLGRKMRKGSGVLFLNWLNYCSEELARCQEVEELQPLVGAIEKARDSLGGSAMHLGGLGMQGDLAGAMLQSKNFLDQFGNVALALHSLRQARIASMKLAQGAEGQDAAFYKGKILNARFYVKQVLPMAMALGKVVTSSDDSVFDESLFV
jgi:alkylation response protein AidB-like acyl-CoA dehydrogenase